MNIKKLFKEVKRILLYALISFLILSLLYSSISLIIHVNSDNAKKTEIFNIESQLIDVEKTVIYTRINRLISDLLYISDSLKLSDTSDGDYTQLEQQWLAFSNRKTIYDQMRYIDRDGNEIIRINYGQDGAYIVEKSQLQNKNDRYYFTDTMSLNENQINISMLDLNVENSEIEQPIKPMLRLSMPYYNESGNLDGMVILNYSANDMLNQIKEIATTSQGSIFLLNSDGYWLYNSSDSSSEWAFMYDDKQNVSFKNMFPEEWDAIKSQSSGNILTLNGVFIYTDLLSNTGFSLNGGDHSLVHKYGDWYMVSYISANTQSGMLFTDTLFESLMKTVGQNFAVYLLLLVISLLFGSLMTISKIEHEEIKYFSENDTMTGVYNRRAGFEKLTQLYQNICKSGYDEISVCFIDINSLKEVNDTLGHEAGDELIISVVNGIKNIIRKNDFVARLGGDEFIIIFEGLNEEKAEAVWMRVFEEYERINTTENRKYLVSVSHGIETITCGTRDHIDTFINHADEKMYAEKRLMKKDLHVIRVQ